MAPDGFPIYRESETMPGAFRYFLSWRRHLAAGVRLILRQPFSVAALMIALPPFLRATMFAGCLTRAPWCISRSKA